MEVVAEQVASQQFFAVEFEDVNTFRYMSIRFWKDKDLCRTFVRQSGLPASDLTGELGSLARLLSVTSTNADIVACSVCSVTFIQTINESVFFSRGVQSCFRFEKLNFATLMHKTSYSVFRRIDFVSVLQTLMISLRGSLTEKWVLGSPIRSKVSSLPCNV